MPGLFEGDEWNNLIQECKSGMQGVRAVRARAGEGCGRVCTGQFSVSREWARSVWARAAVARASGDARMGDVPSL